MKEEENRRLPVGRTIFVEQIFNSLHLLSRVSVFVAEQLCAERVEPQKCQSILGNGNLSMEQGMPQQSMKTLAALVSQLDKDMEPNIRGENRSHIVRFACKHEACDANVAIALESENADNLQQFVGQQ